MPQPNRVASHLPAREGSLLTRRAFVGGLPPALVAAHVLVRNLAWAQAPAGSQLILHRAAPLVAEMPLKGLTSWITPNDLFFILTIMANPLPTIDPGAWRLSVEGQVDRPLTLSYEQLRALPARRVVSVLECAGNSRNSASPPLPKSFLGNGYVGNAEWRGAPLQFVLEQAGIKASAREVVLEGTDRGKAPFAPAEANFAKSLPLEKALHPDTLLVYEMNGAPLPREHGGPVRALVPGWYGTYNVKWLARIEVLDRSFDGAFMTRNWRVRRRHDGHLREEAVSQVAVKSLIVSPQSGQKLAAGAHRITGAAWSGGKDITSVQVSTDGGKSWQFARLLEPHATYAWRLWEFPWQATAPGEHTLMARATDTSGAAQPFAYDLDLNGFAVNQVQPVRVEVG
ncbi:MAG: sulfite oxidase [Candidatus Rokubacteria bacterium]|nr:sulfite oxidase [Candidatus Rokubacteria bacterium]